MKLKTTMRIDGKMSAAIGTRDDMEDDAAAAHALMQALGEIEGTYADCAPAKDIRQFLTERAEELLHEWGFDDKVTP